MASNHFFTSGAFCSEAAKMSSRRDRAQNLKRAGMPAARQRATKTAIFCRQLPVPRIRVSSTSSRATICTVMLRLVKAKAASANSRSLFLPRPSRWAIAVTSGARQLQYSVGRRYFFFELRFSMPGLEDRQVVFSRRRRIGLPALQSLQLFDQGAVEQQDLEQGYGAGRIFFDQVPGRDHLFLEDFPGCQHVIPPLAQGRRPACAGPPRHSRGLPRRPRRWISGSSTGPGRSQTGQRSSMRTRSPDMMNPG